MATCADALKEAVKRYGGVVSSKKIFSYIKRKYPGVWKDGTIRGHMMGCSVNHSSSHHYKYFRKFLFTVRTGRVRLYDPETDGKWKWTPTGMVKIESSDVRARLPSIFLAHDSADKFFARKLAEQLRDSGITVWIDEAEIKVGDSLTQKISKAIEESDFFGLLISHESVNSEWVKKELEIALQREIRERRVVVFPILIEKVEIPAFLRDKHYADFTNPEKFVSSLRNLVDSITLGITEYVKPKPIYLPAKSETVRVMVHPPTLDAKTQLVHFENIHIEDFDDETSHNPDPSNDLYNIYLKLSGTPPTEWEKIFNVERRFPRHDRWRQAWIKEEYIIIYCVPEELEEIHYEDLQVDVKTTNDKYRKLLTERAQEEALKESKEEKVLTRLRSLKDRLARTRERSNESIIKKRKNAKPPREGPQHDTRVARAVGLNQRIEADQNIVEVLLILDERPHPFDKIDGPNILVKLRKVTGDNTRQPDHVKDAVAILREENMAKVSTSVGRLDYGFDQVWITPSGRNYLKIRDVRA